MALDWDHLPQATPGLIFNSRIDRRRLFPAPDGWLELGDEDLMKLCISARSMLY
ncbi:MAG: hypothetical protein JWO05_716 [Gemmatimonadetes bacterium]|nr:hypothetical protein [Gemmatimonadota bacterium]